MKQLVLTLFILIIPIKVASQDYPKKAIIESDTVAILTIDQVKIINGKLIDLREVTEERDTLIKMINEYSESTRSLNEIIRLKDEVYKSQESQIKNYESINNELRNKYRRQRLKSITFGGISIALGLTAIISILK